MTPNELREHIYQLVGRDKQLESEISLIQKDKDSDSVLVVTPYVGKQIEIIVVEK